MADCVVIPEEKICLIIGETIPAAIGTPDFDIQGAKLEVQFRKELKSGVAFGWTTEGLTPSITINLDNTFTIDAKTMDFPIGIYYGDWWFTLAGGEPFLYWRTEIKINPTYTKTL
jgi:hypothetical protein